MHHPDRRTFLSLSGATAALALLPLAGCGGGDVDEGANSLAVAEAQEPMRAAVVSGPQFQVLGRAHAVVVTDTDGRQRRFGSVGRAAGKLNFPAGVAVINGLAYVVETGNHRVQIFDANGAHRGFIGEGQLLYPGAIAVGRNEILVADSRNARIVGFGLDGSVTRVLGAGILSAPRGLTLSGTSVLVADAGLRKVLKLDSSGSIEAELGNGWVLPWDVATDGRNAYVADISKNEIAVLTLTGKRLSSLPLGFAPANVTMRNGAVQATAQI